jgi:hypothetical protein
MRKKRIEEKRRKEERKKERKKERKVPAPFRSRGFGKGLRYKC